MSDLAEALPHDVDAERAVLGACMWSGEALRAAREAGLTGSSWFRPAHVPIWHALVTLAAAGNPTDPVAVKAELERRGPEIGQWGGAPYLADLHHAGVAAADVRYYVGIVRRHAVTRALIVGAARVDQLAHAGDPDAAREALADVREIADQVLDDTAPETTRDAPDFAVLADFLAVEDEPVRYRVDRLWPVGGRVVLAAQYKAGKTTARDNLVRALVDKEDYLGAYGVEPPAGRVVIIDNELDARMLRAWLRDQGIANTDRVAVLPLRGRLSTFDVLDPAVRARWAAKLRAVEAGVVILDCLRPVLDALALSEDKDAGRFLVAFDELLDAAGVSEGLVVHHMGHNGERSRGDSRILDWPDVTWTLVRERGDDGESVASARRYFAAYGRDVDVEESLLAFTPEHRRLTIAGGTRRETAADAVIPEIVTWLTDNPGVSGRAIEKALVPKAATQKALRMALKRAIESGDVEVSSGPRNATLHFVPERVSASSASPVRQRTSGECVSASIETHSHHTHEQLPEPPTLTHSDHYGTSREDDVT